MLAMVVVVAAVLVLVGLGAFAGWSVMSQTRKLRPDVPGSGGGGNGGGGGPVKDAPVGGSGPQLSLTLAWTLQDDVDVHLLLERQSQY